MILNYFDDWMKEIPHCTTSYGELFLIAQLVMVKFHSQRIFSNKSIYIINKIIFFYSYKINYIIILLF